MTADDEAGLIAALQADLAQHAAWGDKVSGGPGERDTAIWISARLAALGFTVDSHELAVPHFEPSDCRLSAGAKEALVHAQAPIVTTGPRGITARLAVVRATFEAEDAAGCIALLVLQHARHASLDSPLIAPLIEAATAAGALALVLVTTGPTNEAIALNAPIDGMPVPMPIAVLAPAQTEPFLRAAREGTPATLRLHGDISRRHTANLHGRLRRGDAWLCLSTPRTGWFGCVGERGTGTAAFLAMAAWAVQRFPELSIFALNTGAHEYRFAGAEHSLALAPPPEHTVAWVHLGAALAVRDRLEFRGTSVELPSADANRTTMATESLREAASAAFSGITGLERVVAPIAGVSELSAIVARGYERAFAVLGLPRVFHTRQDHLGAVDAALLAPVVRAHMRVVEQACCDALPAMGIRT